MIALQWTYGRTESSCRAAELRKYRITNLRNYESMEKTEVCSIAADKRIHETSDLQTFMENKKKTYTKKGATEKRKFKTTESVDSEVRKFVNPIKPLMSEAEKSEAQILDLSYDFACRIIRLYKYLNEGKLSKADRDIIDALGRQLVRSATSINANMNEAQHPQSDADFLSKTSIALKEARESENWLRLLSDNGYLEPRASESLINDCARINKILITITSKVKKRINGPKE